MPTHHVWRRFLCAVAAGLASSVVFAAGELTAYSMVTRDGRPLANVTNIVDEGVLYRNARYEDEEAEFGRHIYRVRSVYKGGRAGAWTEFAPLSRTGGADESAVVEHEE